VGTVRSRPAPASELARRMRRRFATAPPSWAWAWAAVLVLLAGGALAVAIARAPGSRPPGEAGLVASSLDSARAALRHSGPATELSLSGMPVPRAGAVYEIWLLGDDGELRPLDDEFTVTRAGRASVALPGDLRRVRELILTRERIGGSERPAGPPLLEILNPSALID
jgi:Anti-sigma-K factor rskA